MYCVPKKISGFDINTCFVGFGTANQHLYISVCLSVSLDGPSFEGGSGGFVQDQDSDPDGLSDSTRRKFSCEILLNVW